MYLIGVFAMLEGCYGEPSWKQQLKPLNGLCKMPASDYSTTDFDLLWHVRDAAVHGMTKQNGNPRFPTTKREELQTWAGIEISTTSNGEQVWLTTPLLKRVRSSSSNSPTRTRVGVRSPPSRRWPNLAVAEARE